jgi:hypothetical protein
MTIMLSGCGVKGDPVSQQGAKIPSVMDNYDELTLEQPLNDAKKK